MKFNFHQKIFFSQILDFFEKLFSDEKKTNSILSRMMKSFPILKLIEM